MAFQPKKPANKFSKPAYGKGKSQGGGYKPTLKDGFYSFFTGLLNVPFATAADTTLVDVESVNALLEKKGAEGVNLRDLLRAAVVVNDDTVLEAMDAIFPSGTEKSLEYALKSFGKRQDFVKNSSYQEVGFDFLDAVKEHRNISFGEIA